MSVLTCSHCGAPRNPGAARCDYCQAPFGGSGAPATGGPDGDIEELVRKDNLIAAIKIHRERYGTDLRTAKAAVEALKQRLGR